MQELLERIKAEARASWPGDEGERRAASVEAFILALVGEYSAKLGFPQADLLAAIERKRTYSAVNYYQAANFPGLDNVRIFETQADLLAAFPSKQFRCPACNGISTHPYECNSGKPMEGGGVGDWKTYGLLRTFGKGLRFTVRAGFLDRPLIDEIFMPIEMETAQGGAR